MVLSTVVIKVRREEEEEMSVKTNNVCKLA